MYRTLFMLVLFSLAGAEEANLFETSFQGLPEGWFNSNWGFEGGDARIDEFVNYWSGDFLADMYTDGEPPALYFVPDGTDSVVIHIEHDIYMGGEDIKAFVEVTSTSGEDVRIFDEMVFWDGYSSAEPIHYTLHDPPPDTWMGFRIHGEARNHDYMGTSQIDWWVRDMTVTAYGDQLSLSPRTWASVKWAVSLPLR